MIAFIAGGLRRLPVDRLHQAATMFILAGLLCIIITLQGKMFVVDYPWTQTFLSSGADCFTLLVWYMVARLGARNSIGALPILLFFYTAHIIGTVLGAGLGHLTDMAILEHPTWAMSAVLLAILLFVGFNLISLKSFSFESTLTQVVPMKKVFVALASQTLEENCKKISDDYKLTPRETEILELLARGRNSQAMQDKLIVSRNTIKTHVKNIYVKLDVHSQQELIDMVEQV